MTFLKTLGFAVHNLSRMGYYHAGAEMCGGSERRAKADAYRNLSNMTGGLVRLQVIEAISRGPRFTVQSQDQL
ncbi:MAG: hypothetical protein AAGI09_15255 [Pseudomonadota bacterium]